MTSTAIMKSTVTMTNPASTVMIPGIARMSHAATTAPLNRWQWRRHDFRAMNTSVEVAHYGDGDDQTAAVERLFHQAEQRMSRFLPDSELSRFNRVDDAPCALSPEFFAVVETALWAARKTDGLYDPTLLAELEHAGYDRSFECIVARDDFQWRVPESAVDAPQVTRRRMAGYADIRLDRATGVAAKPAGVRLDLGGIGKGWTVDRAAELLLREGAFLVNAGGDLYAHGQPGDPRGWAVTIEHPLDRTLWIARLLLDHAGLATSTTMKRRWRQGARTQHHLIDPRSGRPADTDALSVTVIAQRTVLAEVFAKAALLLGAEAGLDYLAQMAGIEGLVYTADGRVLTTPGLATRLDAVEAAGASS
ncbi:MAG: FAD:protein FMN transferase [Anaerolineales bacterium]|nr:FAD:protein FMN transferase [Anaerolineales bacterium]